MDNQCVKLFEENIQLQNKSQFEKYTHLLLTDAENGHIECVNVLLEQCVNVNICDKEELTALHKAASGGHLEIVIALIEHGIDVNAVDNRGYGALYKASSEGHLDIVSLLVEHGANVNICSNSRITALHKAASGGHLNIVKLLEEHGANVNASDWKGITPLHCAISSNYLNIVKFLIECNVNVNAIDNRGYSALHYAVQEVVNLDIVKLLLENGVHIDDIASNRFTALHKAAYLGHLDCVYLLVACGINTYIRDYRENTALSAAANSACANFLKNYNVMVRENNLANLCRNKIRRHLLYENPKNNLLFLVSQLDLAPYLRSYVLLHCPVI